MHIEALNDRFGVIASDLDLADPISPEDIAVLQQLWLDQGLVLVRARHVSSEAQIAFSRLFGALEEHPITPIRNEKHPELMELNSADARSNPIQRWDGVEYIGRLPWHKDMIYTAKPNRGAVLRAIVLPSQGGHTGFADQQLAYDALSPSTKAQIDDLKVVYRFEVNLFNMPFLDTRGYDPGPNGPKSPADLGFPDFPDALYPLVLTHPVTGRRSLNVCPMFMERVYEYDREEGDALLRELVTHVTSPSFSYLHHWEEGDMVLWDNWRMMHCASGIHPGDQRVIYRTTIAGDSVLGTQLPKVS